MEWPAWEMGHFYILGTYWIGGNLGGEKMKKSLLRKEGKVPKVR